MKNMLRYLRNIPVWVRIALGILILLGIVGVVYVGLQLYSQTRSNSPEWIGRWFGDRESRPDLTTTSNRKPCPNAPFILPSDGFIGLLYRDPAGPYTVLHRHTGIDIFGDGEPGKVPIYAAYDGYLTRLLDWKSSVAIQHDDPLEEGRKIWTYYTHMASADGETSFIATDFPPETYAKFVKQGTLIGYQGEYAGNVAYQVGLHVHFSVIKSEDDGSFKNEAILENTLDPSPYLGMDVTIDRLPDRPIQCGDGMDE
jgi:peptidoglycan LD-endopeptidase LytH